MDAINNETTPAPIGPSKQSHDALKAVMLVVLFFSTFLASTASLPFRNFVRSRAATSPYMGGFLSLASCFGAGVFLATCLLDMLPDVLNSWARADQRVGRRWGVADGPSRPFPLCALFIAVGFLLVLILEQVAQCALEWVGQRAAGGGGSSLFTDGHHQQRHQAVPVLQQQSQHDEGGGGGRRDSQRQPLLGDEQQQQEQHQTSHNEDAHGSPSFAVAAEHQQLATSMADQQHHHHQQQSSSSVQHQQQLGAEEQEQHQQRHNGAESDGSGCVNNGGTAGFDLSTLRVLLLLVALNLHACFEGISLGTFTDVSVLTQIFVALLIHKSIVGFSLGIRLVQSNLSAPIVVLCCTLFAVQVLIGGFISLALMDLLAGRGSAVYMVAAIAQAIACGTFLYITTMEILPHEFSLSSDAHQHQFGISSNTSATFAMVIRGQKVALLLIGFALITAFVAIFPDADDGNGNGLI
ncbi:hypothetical protein niasHS_018042 [Heterodera schachtii]|uniref:Zinc transporter ZIP1 n=1 Tax=Heterodera schachtii TaxID=97005 RepID=A0ABD2HV23_HETSC